MKGIRKAVVLFVALLLIAASSAAMAAEMTPIERSWYDFQKLVTDQLVKDGKITQEEASKQMFQLEQKLTESPEDIIYKRISQKGFHAQGGKGKMLVKVYAELTNRSVEEVKKASEGVKLTIWQLAKNEGKLDVFKNRILELKTAQLEALVKEGKITKQKRDEKLKHLKQELDKISSLQRLICNSL